MDQDCLREKWENRAGQAKIRLAKKVSMALLSRKKQNRGYFEECERHLKFCQRKLAKLEELMVSGKFTVSAEKMARIRKEVERLEIACGEQRPAFEPILQLTGWQSGWSFV